MRFAFFCGIIAALLCLTQNANAQYARKGADLESQNGFTLSDQDIISIVGNDVFDQTVVGARKQYKAGKGLIIGGVLSCCASLAGCVYTAKKMNEAGYNDLQTAVGDNASIAGLYLGTTALMSAGFASISGGIVLKTIGKKRLDWVSEECNNASNVSLNVGATPHGFGIALNF